ncbi:hypothetical protein [Pelosinus sp. sgz500959]|uniref:hypothetical protein n=1 Tax=Pelosinus sp. sgz500959 TaxID=3242472 RepID=UPI00367339A0
MQLPKKKIIIYSKGCDILMASVIEFPTKSVINLQELESSIRKFLYNHTDDSELIENVTCRMKAYAGKYLNKDINFNFSTDVLDLPTETSGEQLNSISLAIDEKIQNIITDIHMMTNEIIAERLKFEIHLYYINTSMQAAIKNKNHDEKYILRQGADDLNSILTKF